MPRLETLSEVQRNTLLYFPCLEFETTPWKPLAKKLTESKLALVTSAGLHLRSDKPFVTDVQGGDSSYRVIPSDTKASEILQSHVSIGFDHTPMYRDLNITFPMDRANELVQRGVIAAISRNYYSFMGALRDCTRMIEETGPEVAQHLLDEDVDLVLLTPT
jgi:D-proline reductase (dithiol) PrdB